MTYEETIIDVLNRVSKYNRWWLTPRTCALRRNIYLSGSLECPITVGTGETCVNFKLVALDLQYDKRAVDDIVEAADDPECGGHLIAIRERLLYAARVI